MPFREEMNWDASKRRWHRFYRGTMYRVVASQLNPKDPTRDGTRKAANEWWQDKQRELDGPPPSDPIQQLYQQVVQEIAADPTQQERVAVITSLIPDKRAAIPDRSLEACGQSFLAVVRGSMRPRSYQELRDYVRSLNNVPGLLTGTDDVQNIDESLVERMYLHLRDSDLSPGRRKKFWSFFRRFVDYLGEKKVITTPANLHSRAFKFKVSPQEIKRYEPEQVRDVLKGLKPRLKLYALLALNAGMTQVDIAELRKDMVDLKTGVLTRKRVKTSANANVPTVRYRLWPETLDLLKQHQSDHPELFLTSMAGTPLLEVRYEGGEVKRKDMVIQQWRRSGAAIPLKSFRSIAASTLERHEVYGRYASYFLGHSPRGVAARHYVQPSAELFAQSLDWLHDQFFKG